MRIFGCFLLAVGLCAGSNAIAQSAPCGSSGYPGFVSSSNQEGSVGFLNLVPANPDSTTPLTLEVGAVSYFPRAVASSVHGRIIEVTLNAAYNGIGIPPPVECLSTFLGTLQAGEYTINLQLIDPDFPTSPPALFSASVTIGGGGTGAVAAPAISLGAMALMGLVLALAGVLSVRTRRA